MKVTFLGVGSAFSRKNDNSNLLIESGNIKLLIDCARSGPPALEKYGLSLKDVTHIFVTHLHADHVGGLEEAAFMTRLVYKQKLIILSTASLLERLWAHSLSGGLEYIEEIPGNLSPQTLSDFFTLQPVTARQWLTLIENPGLRLYLHPTDHVRGMESYGLEIEEVPGGREKRFLFSGDTKFDNDLIRHGFQSCSSIFHDCQLFNSGKNNRLGVHASYHQLVQLPAEIRGRMWLYHYGDTRPLPDAKHDGFAGFVTGLQSFIF
jgi:ribonuclease BN (tRNA processing enzyme)